MRWDLTSNTFTYGDEANGFEGHGITVDLNGNIWIACNDGSNSVREFSPTVPPHLLGTYYPPGLSGPAGVAVAQDGNILVSGRWSDNWAKLDDATGTVMPLGGPEKTGLAPCSFSDFTGNLQALSSAQQGSWTVVTDAKYPDFFWNYISWTANLPSFTSVGIEARAADAENALNSSLPWTPVSTSGALNPALRGQFLQTRVRLKRSIPGCAPAFVTPSFDSLTVAGVCDSCVLIGCPRDTVIPCTSPSGACYSYVPPVAGGLCNSNSPVSCSPPSGHQFPIGTTLVTCSTQLSTGSTISCNFTVTVTGDCVPPPTGACCLRGVICTDDETQAECQARGGVYLGDGQPCTMGRCISGCSPPPGGLRAWWPLDDAVANVTPNLADAGVPGTLVGSPPGDPLHYVNGSYTFNGTSQCVAAGSAPSLALGSGDFSLDAWVRTTDATGLGPIIDKRDPATTTVQGYSLFLWKGYPGVQLAVGGAASSFALDVTNGGTGAFVADGVWHHVTATVKRNQPDGIRIYVDGTLRGTALDPTGCQGNLDNDSPLYIGRINVHLPPSTYFAGQIDEVEIFNRALRPDEVLALARADTAGKCPEGAYTPSNLSCCRGAVSTGVTICNYSDADHLYSWGVSSSVGSGCPTIAATTLSPPSGSVSVPAHSCMFVPFLVVCPTALGDNQASCFTVSIYNHDTGKTFACLGSVRRRPRWLCWEPRDSDNLPVRCLYDLAQLTPGAAHLHVEPVTTDSLPSHAKYRLRALAGESDSSSEMVSINGLPGGQVFSDSVLVPTGGSCFDIPVTLAYLSLQPLGFDRIVVEAIDDESGQYQTVCEFAIRDSVPASTVSVPESPVVPPPAAVFLALPNPFSTSTKISFSLPADGQVSLAIFDVRGRVVRDIFHGQGMTAGVHDVDWDARDGHGKLMPVGMYFIRLETGAGVRTAKMVLRR